MTKYNHSKRAPAALNQLARFSEEQSKSYLIKSHAGVVTVPPAADMHMALNFLSTWLSIS
jgi:hypothetical protein